uniref:RH67648p n=1 Tax=Drosophila melanogaster TaxID=7227 RepID=E4NKM2_DROME|nr:RH67648p [Drosophila melanogaster]
MANVKIVESKLDIFHAPQTHSLAHAVESSFTAERGTLAWQFALIYGDVDELRQRSVSRGNCAVLEHNARFIYYLVTKSSLYEASTYGDVQAALICMRKHVKRLVQQTFSQSEYPIEILICEHEDMSKELAAPKCQITEARGNLFSAPENYALVHSVSADFAMCAGINLQFRCKFGQVDELKRQHKHTGNVAVLEQDGRHIYNLVTKERSHEKCTYAALYYALLAMREHMREHGVTKLAIPRLGCGIDRLDWLRVRSLLDLVFAEDSVDIIAFFYTPPQMVKDTLNVVCPTCRHTKTIHLPSRSVSGSRNSLHREKTPF